jgi:catechol 2,3-dioxygenase-like lactoylglutathione lyase family enzyme
MIRGGLVTLWVRDVNRAIRFYVETLGMKLVLDSGISHAVIDAGEGFLLALALADKPPTSGSRASASEGAPTVGLSTKVPLAEAVAIYENRGVVFELRDGVAHFRDPDDNPLYLFEVK